MWAVEQPQPRLVDLSVAQGRASAPDAVEGDLPHILGQTESDLYPLLRTHGPVDEELTPSDLGVGVGQRHIQSVPVA